MSHEIGTPSLSLFGATSTVMATAWRLAVERDEAPTSTSARRFAKCERMPAMSIPLDASANELYITDMLTLALLLAVLLYANRMLDKGTKP